jgi:non-homologous end joining protein Ku
MQKTFASGIQLRLGLFTVIADAVPIRQPNSAKSVSFSLVCPDCDEPQKVQQQYQCPAGHGPFTPAQLHRARETEDGLVPMSAEDLAKVAGEFIEGAMELRVVSREDVEAKTRPDGGAYRLRLGGKKKDASALAYTTLIEAMKANSDKVLLGVLKLNGRVAPTPYKLEVWEGQLILQSLVRPQDLAERDDLPEGVDEKYVAMASQLIEQMVEPFDPELLADERVQRLAEVLAEKEGDVVAIAPKKSAGSADDLMAALEASLKRSA